MSLGMPRAEDVGVDITDELAATGLDQAQVARVRALYEECVSKLHSHQRRSDVFNRMSVFFGLPITIFAAVSGTAAFVTLGQQVGGSWRLVVVLLSLTITILSTIQTFFRFSEQAAKEQVAANQYSELLWEIRIWANTTQRRERAYVDSFISDVVSQLQDIDAQYRGGGPQRRAVVRSSLAPDTAPPTVSSISPLPGAVEVTPITDVTATFSKHMDPATITPNTFTLVEEANRTPVSGMVMYDPPTRTATFSPRNPLNSSTAYRASVTTGIRDQMGNALPQEDSWEFTVAP